MVMTRKKSGTGDSDYSETENTSKGRVSRKTASKKRDASAGAERSQEEAPVAKRSGMFESLFSFLETHPSLPHILSFYAQLLLNVFLVFSFMYIIYSFWRTITEDVNSRVADAQAKLLADIAVCAQQFRDNRCERETRLPALEGACDGWERCMARDPKKVGRAQVSAHTFAQIFNSFIEPISYKAMVSLRVSIVMR